MDFSSRKSTTLSNIHSILYDKSPKGSIDVPIIPFIEDINSIPNYYTTSSCSGRITIFKENKKYNVYEKNELELLEEENEMENREILNNNEMSEKEILNNTTITVDKNNQNKGGEWLLTSHDKITCQQMLATLDIIEDRINKNQFNLGDSITLRFEPFIMSIECNSLESAGIILKIAHLCGFRESGLTAFDKRYMISIRCSLKLEVPIWEYGSKGIFISRDYATYLTQLCNKKMDFNFSKINYLHSKIIERFIPKVIIPQPVIEISKNDYNKLNSILNNFNLLTEKLTTKIESIELINDISKNSNNNINEVWCLVAVAKYANLVQDMLRETKFKSKNHRVIHLPRFNSTHIAIPITDEGRFKLQNNFNSILKKYEIGENIAELALIPEKYFVKITNTNEVFASKDVDSTVKTVESKEQISLFGESGSPYRKMVSSLKKFTSPHLRACCVSQALNISDTEMWNILQFSIPKKWEILGDAALLPQKSFDLSWKFFLGTELSVNIWEIVANVLNVARIAKQAEIHPDLKRHSQVKMMYPVGASGWVSHRELGLKMELDITKCMFSSGNGTEKLRIINLVKDSPIAEVFVDLFAGIGYFSIPLLVHTNIKHLHMCEWNENALIALERNFKGNKINPERGTIHPGDNRLLKLENIADRINLGLIPTSEDSWPIAVKILKNEGGWMHIHANEHTENEWANKTKLKLKEICIASNKGHLNISITHIEIVKNYAPHVIHIVADAHFHTGNVRLESGEIILKHKNCVQIIEKATPLHFWNDLFALNTPVILRGINLGSAIDKWTPEYMAKNAPNLTVTALISTEDRLNFTERNYIMKTMSLSELILRASKSAHVLSPAYFLSPNENYYMRSMGDDVKSTADFPRQFASVLAKDLILPPEWIANNKPHSSAFRCSGAGVHLWTHFDISDNFLCHVVGKKRVTLFPPTDLPYLYAKTSSSDVIDIANPDLNKFPKFSMTHPYECTLIPGDVLFIPALWFHNVFAHDFAVSVNYFWHNLSPDEYWYDQNDIYGNKDLIFGQQAQDKAVEIKKALSLLPASYSEFYKLKSIEILNSNDF